MGIKLDGCTENELDIEVPSPEEHPKMFLFLRCFSPVWSPPLLRPCIFLHQACLHYLEDCADVRLLTSPDAASSPLPPNADFVRMWLLSSRSYLPSICQYPSHTHRAHALGLDSPVLSLIHSPREGVPRLFFTRWQAHSANWQLPALVKGHSGKRRVAERLKSFLFCFAFMCSREMCVHAPCLEQDRSPYTEARGPAEVEMPWAQPGADAQLVSGRRQSRRTAGPGPFHQEQRFTGH